MLKHPELSIDYHEFDILYQDERPWLTATLDGELTEKATGRKGIYEGKTGSPTKKHEWAEWKGKIPQHYYVQVLHQLAATGYDFVYVYALLTSQLSGESVLRELYFERAEHEASLAWVVQRESSFMESVMKREMPAMLLEL